MVRSSEIVKKSSEKQGREKVDASSAFLLLSEIMLIKTSDGTADRPPLPAIPDTPVNPVAPEIGNIQQEAGKSRDRVIETERDAPAAVAFNDQTLDKVEDLYSVAKNYMREVRIAVVQNQSLDIAPAFELVKKIVSQPELILNIHPLTIRNESDQDYYILQPIHTMFYALKIGLHMSYTPQQLMELGLCCLLQNIGMFLIPDHIINKRGALSAEEISVIRKHPETGRDLLRPFQADYPWLLESVYQHHERENGKGYPLGIKGDEITEYAKLIGLCDSYEAMTHNRPHRKAIMQFDSIRQLIQSKDGQFSPQILKLFFEELSIYPVGSYVRLNNAAIGMVIATNKSQPMRPVINLLIDGKGNRVVVEETVDLAKNNVLTILDVVTEEDIPR
jgi:HD-GYP domain-containing protein (c-di-GMP phosphodiesterase class II)